MTINKAILFPLFFLTTYMYTQSHDSIPYYSDMVNNPKTSQDLLKAYSFFRNIREDQTNNDDKLRTTYYLWYLASIEYKLGQYYDSENTAVEGLKLLEGLENTEDVKYYKVSLLNQIGIIRSNLDDKQGALSKYSEILELAQSDREKGIAHNNIGATYKTLERYEEAIKEFNIAVNLNKKAGNRKEFARSLDNLGEVQSILNDRNAIVNLKESLSIRTEINDHDLFISYKNLSKHYKRQNDVNKANYYAEKGYEVAKKFNSQFYIKNALSNLLELGKENYSEEYISLVDSIDDQEKKNEVKYAEAKYRVDIEREKTRAEIRKKEKAQERADWYELFYGSLVGFAALTLIFTILYLEARHKKNTIQKQFETEQRISKKLHDEVANDVFYVMAKAERGQVDVLQLVDDLENIYHKTRDISKANAELNVSEGYTTLLSDLINTYKTYNVNIITRKSSQIQWDQVSDQKKKVLYRVLQELLTNMKKHSDASLVTLTFEQLKNKIKVTYIDNGVGCHIYKGAGLRNTENRIELIGGKITFESEPGKGFQAIIIM